MEEAAWVPGDPTPRGKRSGTLTAVLGQPVSASECEPPLRTFSGAAACSPAQDMAPSPLAAQRGGSTTTASAPYNGDEVLLLRQRVRVLERQQESLHVALTEANAKRSEAEVELKYVRSQLAAAGAQAAFMEQRVAEAQEEARAAAAAAAQKVAEAQAEAQRERTKRQEVCETVYRMISEIKT